LINISVKDLDGQVHEIQGREGDSLMEALRQQEWIMLLWHLPCLSGRGMAGQVSASRLG